MSDDDRRAFERNELVATACIAGAAVAVVALGLWLRFGGW